MIDVLKVLSVVMIHLYTPLVVAISLPIAESAKASHYNIFLDKLGRRFDGIGGLSAGATTQLLPGYPSAQQSEILDFLFKPNFGASMHICKVEIGGDGQSTDGTESSHMHTEHDEDYHRGYEWFLMAEARKRNPNVLLWGLPWTFPGWVGEGTSSPYTNLTKTVTYVLNWMKGARDVHGLYVDIIGIWNERDFNVQYIEMLRQALDSEGFSKTIISAPDNPWEPLAKLLPEHPELRRSVGSLGAHYPRLKNSKLQQEQAGSIPLWASEEWSSYSSERGAACWAHSLNEDYLKLNTSSFVMWSTLAAYYSGTAWYGAGALRSVEPWSGHYENSPVVWAMAHTTHFTVPGDFLVLQGQGSGELQNGGTFVTYVSRGRAAPLDFTLVATKLSAATTTCQYGTVDAPTWTVEPEVATFFFPAVSVGTPVAVWQSTFNFSSVHEQDDTLFQKIFTKPLAADHSVTVELPVDSITTVTTHVTRGHKGRAATPPPPSRAFPLPWSTNFSDVALNGKHPYLADQVGVFEGRKSVLEDTASVVYGQAAVSEPVYWEETAASPMTVFGEIDWRDIHITVTFLLPIATGGGACAGARVTQIGKTGVFVCFFAGVANHSSSGSWILSTSMVPAKGCDRTQCPGEIFRGPWLRNSSRSRHTMELVCIDDSVVVSMDGSVIHRATGIDLPNGSNWAGLASVGAYNYSAVEFTSLTVAPSRAISPVVPPPPIAVQPIRIALCASGTVPFRNGLQAFRLRPLLIVASNGMCVTAKASGVVQLQECDVLAEGDEQWWQYRDGQVRFRGSSFVTFHTGRTIYASTLNGPLRVSASPPPNSWTTFVYDPRSGQFVSANRLNLCWSLT